MIATKETLKFLVALLIGGAILWVGQIVMGWKEAHDLSKQQMRTAEATSGILKDEKASMEEQDKQSSVLIAGRERFTARTEEAKQNDPTVAERANRPVPDSLRRAYRERRLSRERLGCFGENCGKELAADAASER